jgi:uroporphyrinogen-III synthase
MRIWVTRTLPEAEATGGRLRALGHYPLIAPVLEVRDVPGEIVLKGAGALAFTSRNGVAAFARRTPERGLPVFAVGAATEAAARGHGFGDVRSAEGDVAALAELILAWHDPARGHILHPGAADPAQDLAGELKRRGLKARRQAIYETLPLPLADAVCAALAADPVELDAVLIHSPRAARCVASLLADRAETQALVAACISKAAAQPLQPLNLGEMRVAQFPNEASLLSLLAT